MSCGVQIIKNRYLVAAQFAQETRATFRDPANVLTEKETIMSYQRDHRIPSRRGVLTLAAGAFATGWIRLEAFSSDFWNKKEPAEWSREEIEQLLTKSPWAKEVSAQYSSQGDDQGGYPRGGGYPGGGGGYPGGGYPGGGYPGGMGGPRIGGMGIPGMGGGYPGGGRRRGGGQGQSVQGSVRWESSKPILDALKTPLPEAFANHYVISVSGFPLSEGQNRRSQEDSDNDSAQSNEAMLDHLKGLTFLEPKGREGAQPGVVQQQPSAGMSSILFGFSKETLALKPEDKEVTFSTKLGRLLIKTKFNLKDMQYRGDLAV
jgi:hypothetical protein